MTRPAKMAATSTETTIAPASPPAPDDVEPVVLVLTSIEPPLLSEAEFEAVVVDVEVLTVLAVEEES